MRGKLGSGLGGQYAALVCLNTTNGDIPQPDMLHGPMNLCIYVSINLSINQSINLCILIFFFFFFFFFSAVTESPSSSANSVTTPVTTGTPITFTMNTDGSGGEFHVDLSSKSERRKSRPPRPPPLARRLSKASGDGQGESDAVDGIRQRSSSVANMDSGPPDSISCVRFACTFTRKNGK